jgi:hypothetical protein
MAKKYIDENDDTIELDDRMLLKSVGIRRPEPNGGGNWKLVGYVEIVENDGGKKYKFCNFKPGCRLMFLDQDEELLSYEIDGGKCTLKEKPMQQYVSNPIKSKT